MNSSHTFDRQMARRIDAEPEMKPMSSDVSNVATFVVNDRGPSVERRRHPRSGSITQLEDITYSVLREHEVRKAAA